MPGFLIFFLLPLIFAVTQTMGGNGNVWGDSTSLDAQECIHILSQRSLSYKGQTEEGNRYDLFAIKFKRQWVFQILNSAEYYSFKPTARTDTIVENSLFYSNGICKLLGSDQVVRKSKYKVVSDIPLAGYYKLTHRGRSIMKSLNYLEYGRKEKTAVGKILSTITSPLSGLFKPKIEPKIEPKFSPKIETEIG